ncbi:MAG: class I SAM-dependent methyltransferase [Anaerolineales bacterium]|nr:class I SAM-dependent methyltransferase [Anaerolineales bacterium]
MDEQLVKQLIAINQKFYSEFASAFSETRSSAQTRLDRIVAYIGDAGKILDLGCGNGRLAERLEREGKRASYVGVDASPQLIAIATARKMQLRHIAADFFVGDITQASWTRSVPFANASFDIALALAVLHHIPSFDLRAAVLRDLRALLKPGARLILTNWAFDRNERQRKRIVAWSDAGFDPRDLETGDALLAWKRGGVGYRFCHLITKEEMMRLADASGFQVVKQYYADAELNLYSVLQKAEG